MSRQAVTDPALAGTLTEPMSRKPAPTLCALLAGGVVVLTTSWSSARPLQDADPVQITAASLAEPWEGVSQGILRDRRTDLNAILGFATAVLRNAPVLPRTLEVDQNGMVGIEVADEALDMKGRVRTQDVGTYRSGATASVYLVTRIAQDPVLKCPVRFEINTRWMSSREFMLEIAVFSQLSGKENQALLLADRTQFGGYEFTVYADTTTQDEAVIYSKDLWHPSQTSANSWEESSDAEPLHDQVESLMEVTRQRLSRIQKALRYD